MALSVVATALLAASVAPGCYKTPRPTCAFVCGDNGACPSDYICTSDNRCHLIDTSGAPLACEDSIPGQIDGMPTADANHADAGMIDASPPDARPPDATVPDAMPADHTGTISISDVRVANVPALDHGGSISISLAAIGKAPAVDHTVPPGVGCKVTLYSPASEEPPDLDEGIVTITGSSAPIPNCTFVPGSGYTCIGVSHAAGSRESIVTGGALPAGGAALVSSGAFTTDDVGRYVIIQGATSSANNGAFPIVGLMTNQLIYLNPAAVNESFATPAVALTAAGLGPAPGAPTFLAGGDMVVVQLTPGGGNHFAAFTTPGIPAGGDFQLDTASQARIQNIPLNGTAVTLACDSAGGHCGTASATILSLTTTDGAVTGAVDMPAAVNKKASVQCASFGTSITIPADVMAVVAQSNPTRVRVGIFRDSFSFQGSPNQVTIVVGHGVLGFTTP